MSEKPKHMPYVVGTDGNGSGGPPGGDSMEARVKALETDIRTLVKDVAEIKGRLYAMPTTFQLLGMVLAIMGSTFAFIRFGMTGL